MPSLLLYKRWSTFQGVSPPVVTIVVVPRERFSSAPACLESLYEHTGVPFHLVWVDGGAPPPIRDYLRAQAGARGFELVRTDHYLWPNRARNLGLRRVGTPYVVFMDNDVVVAPGWLGHLVRCADETGAAVVGPLNCEGLPLHEIIHFAGGDCSIREERQDGCVGRHMVDKIDRQGQRLAEVRHELKTHRTSVAEFHCLMVRASIFDKTGPFDDAMLTVRENLDFCLAVAEAGGSIYLEPASIVTYLGDQPLAWRDMPYFLLRWNDRWTLSSLHRFRDKWSLTEDEYFQRQYRTLQRWRHDAYVIRPLFAWIPFRWLRRGLERIVRPVERFISRAIVTCYTRRHMRGVRDQHAATPAR
jgi:GT2 family glycosyltransferase